MIGRQLNQYRIVEAIGAGGMGVVYRAHDAKLDRDVALKVLPSGSLADEHERKRFRKEALALSRLSHPHIASLFDFDTTDDGTDFLVMELVPGATLDAELKRGALPEKDVVRLGGQVARALVAAHRQGVLHRDLKPQNVKLTADGLVKVLDFGLARVAPALVDSQTTDTASGSVAGTPPYMSPEQLLGREVDERTDVYAAGVVLYELATGRKPYGEASGPQLVARILTEPVPPPREANPHISPQLEQVILKASDKNRELRHQTARDLLVDLERLAAASVGPASSDDGRRSRSGLARPWAAAWWPWFLAALLGLALIGALLWPRPADLRVASVRTLLRLPRDLNGLETDGTSVYYVEAVRPADRLMQVPVVGGPPREMPLPWSGPRDIALRGLRLTPPCLLLCVAANNQQRLWRFPLPDGVPAPLAPAAARCQAAWSRAGDRLAWVESEPTAETLFVGTADGEERRVVFQTPRQSGETLSLELVGWTPGDEHIRFWRSDRPDRHFDVSLAGDLPREAFALPETPDAATWGMPEWTRDGRYLLYPSVGGLVAYREPASRDPDQLPKVLAAPSHLFRMRLTPDGRRVVGFVSRTGTEVVRLDPLTKAVTTLLGGARAGPVRFSPDGARVAWVSADGDYGKLWLSRPDGSERVKLADIPMPGWAPVQWSPDGRSIGFTAYDEPGGGNRLRLYLARPGTGGVELLAPSDPNRTQGDPCWSPDGRWMAYSAGPLGGFPPDDDVYLRHVDMTTRAVTRLPGSEGLWSPRCAADGRMLAADWFAQRAYAKSHEGPDRPGLAFFKVRDPVTARWRSLSVPIPPPGGTTFPLFYPTWARDGRHVYAYHFYSRSVVRFDVESPRLETVFEVEGLGEVPFPWMDLDPTDAPLVHRDVSQREIVVMDLEWGY